MSESADFYMSWLGCSAFGVVGKTAITAPEPVVFLPTDLSNCVVWFDANNANTITTAPKNNTAVLTWTNQGTTGGDMVPDTGTGYTTIDSINSLNVIQFPDANTMSWYGQILNQDKTCFIVYKSTNDLTTLLAPYIDLFNGNAYYALQLGVSYYSGLFYYVLCNNSQWCMSATSATNPYNVPQYISFRITSSLSDNFIHVNSVNVPLDTNDHTATGFNEYPVPYLVNRTDGSSQDCAEIIIYNRALTDQEVAQVEIYLAAKWAIT